MLSVTVLPTIYISNVANNNNTNNKVLK